MIGRYRHDCDCLALKRHEFHFVPLVAVYEDNRSDIVAAEPKLRKVSG